MVQATSTHLSRRSSVAEQLIRNQQVAGSNPIAGSSKINALPSFRQCSAFQREAQGKHQNQFRPSPSA